MSDSNMRAQLTAEQRQEALKHHQLESTWQYGEFPSTSSSRSNPSPKLLSINPTSTKQFLLKSYEFSTSTSPSNLNGFQKVLKFISLVGAESELVDHHPLWANVYNRIEVLWSTHDSKPESGSLTELDIKMAAVCDRIYREVEDGKTK